MYSTEISFAELFFVMSYRVIYQHIDTAIDVLKIWLINAETENKKLG